MSGPLDTQQGKLTISRVTSVQMNAFYEAWASVSLSENLLTWSVLNQIISSFMNFYEQFKPFGPPTKSALSAVWLDLTANAGLMPSGSLISLIQSISKGEEQLSALVLPYPLEQLTKTSRALKTAKSSVPYCLNPPSAAFHHLMESLIKHVNALCLDEVIKVVPSLYRILTGPKVPKPLDGLCQAFLNLINAPIGLAACPESSFLTLCSSQVPDYENIVQFLSPTGGNGAAMLNNLYTHMNLFVAKRQA